jgi:rhamnosyltransferase
VASSYYAPPPGDAARDGVLYVGNFQNLPNVDALEFFATDVWPLIRLEHPDAKLSVVGANPTPRVERFDGQQGIRVIGPVPDLRPWYHGHRVMVAPIRAGSGTRLKILEAFAAGLPVVSTTLGAEGIAYENGSHLLVADTATELAREVGRVLRDDELARSLAVAGLELARDRYDWRLVADILLDCYAELGARPASRSAVAVPALIGDVDAPTPDSAAGGPHVSIIIPTLNGGEMLASCLAAIEGQDTELEWELICIDSGSSDSDLDTMRRHGARILSIDKRHFNHGLTRDLAARHGRGEILVFLNQDAVPGDPHWLRRLTEALLGGDPELAAVQGGIQELPDPEKRFFWDSCGERFYFTRESFNWLDQYRGIGFSTVNCAIRRSVWQRHPFGWARIMEDKKWQREVVDMGFRIAARHDAAVLHTHDYDLRTLLRRCRSEGFGWRSLGESYRLHHMVRDMLTPRIYRELLGGLLRGRVRSSAELLFPWARPIALWWGNNRARDVAL